VARRPIRFMRFLILEEVNLYQLKHFLGVTLLGLREFSGRRSVLSVDENSMFVSTSLIADFVFHV